MCLSSGFRTLMMSFMTRGWPLQELRLVGLRFLECLNPRAWPCLAPAYEMVAVLWEQKKYDAAVRLEQLWNELARTHSFYLCCAYPASEFQGELKTERYAAICAEHADVVSAF